MTAAVKAQRKMNVRPVANLFEVEIPLVVLLSKQAGQSTQHFIACAIPDEDGQLDYYFAVFVGRQNLIRYFNEQCDLRFLFAFASGRKYYTFKNLPKGKDKKVAMQEFDGELGEHLFPDSRFFVTSHTSDYGIQAEVGVEQRLMIDGHWDMQEFGGFYQKFSDLYSYKQAIAYLEEADTAKTEKVQRAFSSKPFKGGSSYLGFFGDLFEIIPPRERPVLEGIEYHSPGFVDLRGKEEILNSIKDSVSLFLESADTIQKAHDDLRSFMTKSKILSITGGAKDVSAELLGELQILIATFYDALPIDGKDSLKALAKQNSIVHAKIGLALFRRLKATAHFFAQGRLSY
ncbi:hypothetical protein KZZ08_12415 [Roseovarius mucosus]|uniref:hypothetical protein n=1 Tax=Roseovarius mucosus TaxID=215743 RepID=UPI001C5E7BDA|nr:hypothetical protein [Roseovarius mucosus]MBW4974426.1 hypothetical protein [Roseovarius mucosus]